MATNRNIQMNYYNGTDYDVLYPETTAEQAKSLSINGGIINGNIYLNSQTNDNQFLTKSMYASNINNDINTTYSFSRYNAPTLNRTTSSNKAFWYSSYRTQNGSTLAEIKIGSNYSLGLFGQIDINGSFDEYTLCNGFFDDIDLVGDRVKEISVSSNRYVYIKGENKIIYTKSSGILRDFGGSFSDSHSVGFTGSFEDITIDLSNLSFTTLTSNSNSTYSNGVSGSYFYTRNNTVSNKISKYFMSFSGTNGKDFVSIVAPVIPFIVMIGRINTFYFIDFSTNTILNGAVTAAGSSTLEIYGATNIGQVTMTVYSSSSYINIYNPPSSLTTGTTNVCMLY